MSELWRKAKPVRSAANPHVWTWEDGYETIAVVRVEPDATWFTIEDPDDPRFQELWALGIVKPVPVEGNDE